MRVRLLKDFLNAKAGEFVGCVSTRLGIWKVSGVTFWLSEIELNPETFQKIEDNQLVLSELVEGKRYMDLRNGGSGFYRKRDNSLTVPIGLHECKEFDLFTELPEVKEEQRMICPQWKECKDTSCSANKPHTEKKAEDVDSHICSMSTTQCPKCVPCDASGKILESKYKIGGCGMVVENLKEEAKKANQTPEASEFVRELELIKNRLFDRHNNDDVCNWVKELINTIINHHKSENEALEKSVGGGK